MNPQAIMERLGALNFKVPRTFKIRIPELPRPVWMFKPLTIRIPRPLQEHRIVAALSFLLFLTSFLLFILVGLSLTIIPPIYIVEVSAVNSMDPVSNAATELKFGIWGVCAISTLNSVTAQGACYGPKLGYTIPSSLLSLVGLSDQIASVVLNGLLVLLVLHLVAAGLSTVIFILSLFLHSHAVAITALVVAIITAIISTVMFAADVALVLVVRNNIDTLFSGADFSVTFGDGVWMILVAMILTWAAVVVLSARACYCCGVRRPAKSPKPTSDSKSAPKTDSDGGSVSSEEKNSADMETA
ncbi:hypothetical protein BJ138DRAFT_1066885 [Hygrophoropsis aurantiaca]|uniref:Uncharacterized protein n=1 Tax=Hygrophoropsis aurantiaca TaxID=72124 RepID=A0ACB8A929_9AGAM|nr:hypothetical protein BJ138DRAFT_1066885 [Hygrophoropsis aurantiaca]